MAIANSIQFWTGILPNITLCLTSQSTGEPTPRKLFKSYFILLWLATAKAGYCEKSRWRGLEGRADIRPDFHRDKPPIAAMGYR